MPSKTTSVCSLRLPAALNADLRKLAEDQNISRGELLRQIVIGYFLGRNDRLNEIVRQNRRNSALLERLLLNDPDPDIIAKIDRQLAHSAQAPSREQRHGA